MPDDLLERYQSRIAELEQLAQGLREETLEAIEGLQHIDRVCFRVKSPTSFLAKASDPYTDPPYEAPLVEIEDQVAGRIIVFFLQDLQLVEERLCGTFNRVESRRRRPEKDAEFGYESQHVICTIPPHRRPEGWEGRDDVPNTFELQIRTLFMHAWAEPQHDIAYKGADELPREIRRELAWVAASAWGADQGLERIWAWYVGQLK